MVCSNIRKGNNNPIILMTECWEENDVIRNKEKQSTICNVEHNKKMSMIYMHSHEYKSNTNATPASTDFLAINKSCYNKSVRIKDSTSDKELTYIDCDNSFCSSSCFLGSARKSWSQIVLPTSLLPKMILAYLLFPPLEWCHHIATIDVIRKMIVIDFPHITYSIRSLHRYLQVSIIIPIVRDWRKVWNIQFTEVPGTIPPF